jgi:hypothetical protein
MRRTRFAQVFRAHFLHIINYSITSAHDHNYKLLSNLMDTYKNTYTVFDSAQIPDSSKKLVHIYPSAIKFSFSPSQSPSYYTYTMVAVFVVDFASETRIS